MKYIWRPHCRLSPEYTELNKLSARSSVLEGVLLEESNEVSAKWVEYVRDIVQDRYIAYHDVGSGTDQQKPEPS